MIRSGPDDHADIIVGYGYGTDDLCVSSAGSSCVKIDDITNETIEEWISEAIGSHMDHYNEAIEEMKRDLHKLESRLKFHEDQLSGLKTL